MNSIYYIVGLKDDCRYNYSESIRKPYVLSENMEHKLKFSGQ